MNRPCRLTAALALLVLGVAADASAQAKPSVDTSASLVGFVVRKGTSIGIPNASVGLMSDRRFSTGSNDSGYFALRNLPVGKQELLVRVSGYVALRLPIELRSGVTDTLQVEMSSARDDLRLSIGPQRAMTTGNIVGPRRNP
jgi:hypothetical protein